MRAASAASAGISSITPATSAGSMVKLRVSACSTRMVPDGSAAPPSSGRADTRAPARREDLEQAGPRRVQAHPLDGDVPSGSAGGEGAPEGRARQVARHREVARRERLAAGHRDRGAVARDPDAERFERALRMIACRHRFLDGRRAVGHEPREQHRALDLGARDLGGVTDAHEIAAVDRERGTAAVRREPRAHRVERHDDAAHRPALEGRVARHHGAKGMGRDDPREQPHRRAGVAGVERRRGGGEPSEPASFDRHDAVPLIGVRAERAQARERRLTVGAGRVAADGRRAVGQGRQHRVAV